MTYEATTYIARRIGREGMYTAGDWAASAALALSLAARGHMRAEPGETVGVWRRQLLGVKPSMANADRGCPEPIYAPDALVGLFPLAD